MSVRLAFIFLAFHQISAAPVYERGTIQPKRDLGADYNYAKYNGTLPAGYKLDADLRNISRCDMDFCSGTVNSGNPSYVCGDARLGPVVLPSCLPLVSLVGSSSTYLRFGGQCPGEFLASWTNYAPPGQAGWFFYPFADGFANDTVGAPIRGRMTLKPGVLVDRFGSVQGNFVAPAGSPYNQRALPPSNLNFDSASSSQDSYNYHVYEVKKPIGVMSGPVTPWFGQPGYGVQFQLPRNIKMLLGEGVLEEVVVNQICNVR
ncbi:hypothetical protein GQ44DRAFT_627530 [Phaeosphaeriaceae sp. PMI808]|nr:hypothetical protein GQ44DRAFT_627530 [Phaeosphaeriaceae sp. PMI808]